jgi:hypothetical protein
MSNVYYEEIQGTPFGILVIMDLEGKYRWFITHGEDQSDNEYLLECSESQPNPYAAVEAALQVMSRELSMWMTAIANKRKEWSSQHG